MSDFLDEPYYGNEAQPPTTAGADTGIAAFLIDAAARFDVDVSRYTDHEPIRHIVIVYPNGTYTDMRFGFSEKHVVDLADRLIAALTEMRDGAAHDLANPEEARAEPEAVA
jgi:hypothetical protein